MKKTLVFLFMLAAFAGNAQYKRKFSVLFDESPGWTKSGWLFSGGVTYAWPPQKQQTDVQLNDNLRGGVKALSAPGISAEIGRFHVVPSGLVFNNVDYSLGFKQLTYRQHLSGIYSTPPTDTMRTMEVTDKAHRTDNNITLNFNLNSVIQFSDFQWIQPSIGIHGDYRLGGKRSSIADTVITRYHDPAEKLVVQLHAKLAYGAKLTSELFIVPGIEIGLWQLNDLHNLRINRKVFHSEYIPLILSVKFLLHRPLNMKPCDIEVEEVDLSKTKRSRKKVKLY